MPRLFLTLPLAALLLCVLCVPARATLDQYGGRTDWPCANTTGHFAMTKIGSRWVFCDALGHGEDIASLADVTATINGDNWNTDHQAFSGHATAATWTAEPVGDATRGYLTITFPTSSWPADAIVLGGLNTSGATVSAYNLTDAQIVAVNPGAGTVTVGPMWMLTNPGTCTGSCLTSLTGTVDLNIGQNNENFADCSRTSLGSATSVSWSGGFGIFTFGTTLPANAIPGNFLFTSGFGVSGWNLNVSNNAEQFITAVNTGAKTITVQIGSNPGTCTGGCLGTGAIDQNGVRNTLAKYTDASYNWGWQTLNRMQQWAFNGVGQDSVGQVLPTEIQGGVNWPGGTQPVPMPEFLEFRPMTRAAGNFDGFLSEPLKDLLALVNTNYPGRHNTDVFDAFDPKLATEWTDMLQQNYTSGGGQDVTHNSPWLAGFYTEDTDQVAGVGAGRDFVSSKTDLHLGFITMIAPPLATSQQTGNVIQSGGNFYADSEVYTKAQATNPAHGTCSISNPCSLHDYLYDEYSGSISALNTAWGTAGFYDNWGSDGTTVTETICASSCTATAYSYTPAHANIDPHSIYILVGGVAKIADTPTFGGGSGAATITEPGALWSPTAGYLSGTNTINYATPAVTLNFAAAPNAAVQITYTYGGWMGGGHGLMDEAGNNSWVGTNYWCLTNNPHNSPYFACGAPGNWQASHNYTAGATMIPTTGNAGNFAFVQTAASCTSSTVGSEPLWTQTFNNSTSDGIGSPCNWVNLGATGSDYESVPNANSTFGADLDAWEAQYVAGYSKTIRNGLNTALNSPTYGNTIVSVPWLGVDTTGAWGAPASSEILQGETPYVDGLLVSIDWSGPDYSGAAGVYTGSTVLPEEAAAYQYVTQWSNDKPMQPFIVLWQTADSDYACAPARNNVYPSVPTQADRGTVWYNTVNYELNTLGANSDYPFVGWDMWQWQEGSAEEMGITSILDNAYDGTEGVSSTVACDGYYSSQSTCGGEAGNYGNMVTLTTQANQLWLGLPALGSGTGGSNNARGFMW